MSIMDDGGDLRYARRAGADPLIKKLLMDQGFFNTAYNVNLEPFREHLKKALENQVDKGYSLGEPDTIIRVYYGLLARLAIPTRGQHPGEMLVAFLKFLKEQQNWMHWGTNNVPLPKEILFKPDDALSWDTVFMAEPDDPAASMQSLPSESTRKPMHARNLTFISVAVVLAVLAALFLLRRGDSRSTTAGFQPPTANTPSVAAPAATQTSVNNLSQEVGGIKQDTSAIKENTEALKNQVAAVDEKVADTSQKIENKLDNIAAQTSNATPIVVSSPLAPRAASKKPVTKNTGGKYPPGTQIWLVTTQKGKPPIRQVCRPNVPCQTVK
jgi:hypothetical protein